MYVSKITYVPNNSKWRLCLSETFKILSLNIARRLHLRRISRQSYYSRSTRQSWFYRSVRGSDRSTEEETDEAAKREYETLGKATGILWRKWWMRGTTMGVNQVGVLACGWIGSIIRYRGDRNSVSLVHPCHSAVLKFCIRGGPDRMRVPACSYSSRAATRRDAAKLSGWNVATTLP